MSWQLKTYQNDRSEFKYNACSTDKLRKKIAQFFINSSSQVIIPLGHLEIIFVP